MKNPLLILSLGILSLCACQFDGDQSSTQDSIQGSPQIEPTEVKQNTTTLPKSETPLVLEDPMTHRYVGLAHTFYYSEASEEPHEIYVTLYFKKDSIDMAEYSDIVKTGDSIIYSGEENQRTRIPLSVAVEHFDLRGLQRIDLFNQGGDFIETLSLKRVEFLQQNISDEFISVYSISQPLETDKYKTNGDSNNESFYVITSGDNAPKNPSDFDFYPIENLSLVQELRKDFPFKNELYSVEENFHQYEKKKAPSKPSDTVLTSLFYDEVSLIALSHPKGNDRLYLSEEPEQLFSMTPTVLTKNGMPVLITQSFMPETDILWSSLMVFNGERYVIMDRQRMAMEPAMDSAYCMVTDLFEEDHQKKITVDIIDFYTGDKAKKQVVLRGEAEYVTEEINGEIDSSLYLPNDLLIVNDNDYQKTFFWTDSTRIELLEMDWENTSGSLENLKERLLVSPFVIVFYGDQMIALKEVYTP